MAPPEKGRRTAKTTAQPLLTKNDPPLKLRAPKPTLTNAKGNSSFGFKCEPPSPDSEDIVPDSDAEMGGNKDAGDCSEDEYNDIYVDDNKGDNDFGRLDPTIDEQSPDEDDRQAMQVVRAPPRIARKTTIVYSDDEVDNGSYPVLEMHQKKNGSIRPPNPDLLRNCAEKPRSCHSAEIRGDKDRVGISTPRIKAQTAARTWHQAKSKTFLAPPRRDMAISKDDFEENRQVNDASDSDNANNTNNVDDADDTEHSEDNMDIQPRRRQRRTANNDMKPSQLRFYS
ncbi:hypothetical protein BYT27DRAFT_7249176, partial [Phlegmacium glaucopus]